MPPVSQKQRGAMRAAAAGKSTLGIPKKVGKDFSKADPGGKLPQRKTTGKAAAKEMGGMERQAKKAAPAFKPPFKSKARRPPPVPMPPEDDQFPD